MPTFSEVPALPSDYLPAPSIAEATTRVATGDLDDEVQAVIDYVAAKGYTFQPWQVAAFITAVRTKPFVILAGISGTGKTRLPRLVTEATGSQLTVIPVRPDWTDSSDLLGYRRLDGAFIPGQLLRVAKEAIDDTKGQYFVLLDEMNIARVEYYLAEVLSRIEDRRRDEQGTLVGDPLLTEAEPTDGTDWSAIRLPQNLCIVGSVNMDETTHGFSRKVLDRSFVIEFSDVDLNSVEALSAAASAKWPAESWSQEYVSLSEFPSRDDVIVLDVIGALNTVNVHLAAAQLQVGYRVRDEIVLFCINAQACRSSFTTRDAQPVDPLDLAISMKVLPRIQGGGASIRRVIESLLSWAEGRPDDERREEEGDGTGAPTGTTFPICAGRLRMMHDRLDEAGFTSYWL